MKLLLAVAQGGENPLSFLTDFGVNVDLLISQGISFGIVALALYYFVFKPVLKVSAERQQKIEQGLKDAQEARENLANAQAVAATKLEEAAKEAAKVLAEARESAKRTIDSATQEALTKAEQIRLDNEAQLARDKVLMKEELKGELAGLVANATEKLIGRILTQEQRAKLASEAVEEISKDAK